jgi:glutamate-1-semialdehyde aminotransferase
LIKAIRIAMGLDGNCNARPKNADAWLHNFPEWLPAGELRTMWLTVENRGNAPWLPGATKLVIALDDAPVAELDLPHAVEATASVTFNWMFRVPDAPGRHCVKFQLVGDSSTENSGGLFAVIFDARTQPTTYGRRLRNSALESFTRCWYPGEGVSWSQHGGGYPLFARSARGCRITDLEGNEYVDFLMGWGSALPGHAHPRVQKAISDALSSGGVPSFDHHLMPEVAEILLQMFPGAEAVTFGKNGSDVCTAAVRLARSYTGRPLVLVCGYHGWQDWYVEQFGFAGTGVPDRGDQLIVPFEFNNLEQLGRLLEIHRGRVAAVMLEPAGPVEGPNGPVRDADREFLAEAATWVRREGALLIFDEIITGFRYTAGSVQRATGVVPDLTCLGKALSGGMPLSALIGKRCIFDRSFGRIFYEPTFRGEVYSLAAAREALRIYQEQDIPAQITSFGNRLRHGIHQICERAGLAAQVIGPPFRMLLSFAEPDPSRRSLMRTLVQQELIRKKILVYQTLLIPSAAHDDEALVATLRAFEDVLERLSLAMKENRFASYLEIPPVPG